MPDPRTRTVALVLALIGLLFAWWGWKQGAYFGSVFYPGALGALLLLALLAAMAPFSARFRGPARVALLALVGLAVLELASALWSPQPAIAVEDAWHCFLYVAVFLLGAWATHLLRERMAMALLPVAAAGALVGIGTTAVLANGGDFSWYLHADATLRFPIGYRNADAAFFLICLWPLMALATGDWDWRLRALAVGFGTVLVELAFLSQSRGSIPAAALATLVFLLLSRDRLRAAAVIGLVAIPAIPALPTLLEVYRHGVADAAVLPLLHDSARAIFLTGAASLLIAALAFGLVGKRLDLAESTRKVMSRGLAVLAILAVIGVPPSSSPATADRSSSSTSASTSSARSAIRTCTARGSGTAPTSAPTGTTSGGWRSTRGVTTSWSAAVAAPSSWPTWSIGAATRRRRTRTASRP